MTCFSLFNFGWNLSGGERSKHILCVFALPNGLGKSCSFPNRNPQGIDSVFICPMFTEFLSVVILWRFKNRGIEQYRHRASVVPIRRPRWEELRRKRDGAGVAWRPFNEHAIDVPDAKLKQGRQL